MEFLKSIVPMIGTALGGPFGTVAATFVAEALGLDSKDAKSVTELLNSGKLTPEQIAQLKIAELEFNKFCLKHEIDKATLDINNTKSARDMQMVTKASTPAVLTYIITIGFFGILTYMMSSSYSSSEPLLVMLGSLATAWIACVNFWFGSSHGSAVKSELLANSQPVK